MEASKEELLTTIELLKYFYQEIHSKCNSLDDLIKKGESWTKEIKEKYNSEVIYSSVQDILLSAIFKFKEVSAIAYNALIMKGGGIKGVAYIGALEELQKHYAFNWYAGTSAGAITAILLGAGYTVEELKDILGTKNFKDAHILKALYNLLTKRGLYEAHTFNVWLEELLATKLDSAFSVEMRDLTSRTTVFASRKDKSVQVFDSHKLDSQQSIASFAARCSMSIPYVFTPQKIDGRNVLDGGMKNNFPVDLILKDEGSSFIGLYLGSKTYKHEKNSVFWDSLKIWTESNEPEILRKYKDKIIIIDPSPISTLKFKLNNPEKEFLLESGRLSALDFLHKNKFLDKNEHNYANRAINIETTRKRLILVKIKRKAIYTDLTLVLIYGIIWYYSF
ncbi:patatin-like phospholipase family protein [uncultured Flavobacterium sp.]|uniref:patatin-like phospholipase family protein n=1 Tax=uncultured Flavobacterium sp. TaxID=165435 RepID=UPI0025D1DFBF|nr:patatin-like phospholipase family protein [uncultured Flavobacterium sp.]